MNRSKFGTYTEASWEPVYVFLDNQRRRFKRLRFTTLTVRVGIPGISKMPASILDARPDNFEAILKAAEEKEPGLLLVLFLGDVVATTGQSWCPGNTYSFSSGTDLKSLDKRAQALRHMHVHTEPQAVTLKKLCLVNLNLCERPRAYIRADCVKAEPIIYQHVNEADKPVTLVRVFVGDKASWRTPEHRLRRDKRLKLKGVPTLIRWESGTVTGRLEDYEADDEKKIKRLMKMGTRSRAGSMSSSTSQSVSSSPRSKSNSYAG